MKQFPGCTHPLTSDELCFASKRKHKVNKAKHETLLLHVWFCVCLVFRANRVLHDGQACPVFPEAALFVFPSGGLLLGV